METRMMRYIAILAALLCAGCATDKVFEEELGRSNMITVENSAIPIPPSATFAWAPQITRYYSDPRFKNTPLQGMFHNAIKRKLQEKGYRYTPSPDQSDLLVGYVLALESAVSDDAIKRIYGVEPGFLAESPDREKYEKGTVIIDVYETRTRRSVWRTILQGFAVFDLSEEERRGRVEATVNMMLQGFRGGS
jgi:hypothetical protein